MRRFWRLGVGVLLLVSFGFGDEQVFESCVHHEICVEEEGKEKTLSCVAILAQADQDLVMETFSVFFPDSHDFQELFDRTCKDRKTAKKAISHYYDARTERDRKSLQPIPDKQKMVEARGCFMVMIEECRTKRAMGLIPDT